MKAEELKSKIHYAIATSIYLDPLSLGFHDYDKATEKCLSIIEAYAKDQIEKDRERVENTSYEYFSGEVTAYQLHQDTPIILE